eukprot:2773072-Prymnesium_polylepis.1
MPGWSTPAIVAAPPHEEVAGVEGGMLSREVREPCGQGCGAKLFAGGDVRTCPTGAVSAVCIGARGL